MRPICSVNCWRAARGAGHNSKGKNRLGVLLMQVHDELRGTL